MTYLHDGKTVKKKIIIPPMCLHLTPTEMPSTGEQHPKILVRAPLGRVLVGNLFMGSASNLPCPGCPQQGSWTCCCTSASPLWLSPPLNAVATTGTGPHFGHITLGAVRCWNIWSLEGGTCCLCPPNSPPNSPAWLGSALAHCQSSDRLQ